MRPDLISLSCVLQGLQKVKGMAYGDSWERRGEIGILHNVLRKVDRLENLVHIYMKTGKWVDGNESLVETTADLAVYALIWLSRLAEVDNTNFNDWLSSTKDTVMNSEIPDKLKEQVQHAYEYILQPQSQLPASKEKSGL